MSPEIKQTIVSTLMELNPKEIAIFGSYARGEQQAGSDIDILMEYHDVPTLFDIAEVLVKFENLNLKVDIALKNNMSKTFYEKIESDLIVIYSDVKQSA